MKASLEKLGRQFLGLFPSRVPVGKTEFDEWVDSLVNTYDFASKNLDDIKFVLAHVIQRLGASEAYKSKFYFFLSFNAAASKQVAGSVFYDIKQRQIAAQAEATANQKAVVSDESAKN